MRDGHQVEVYFGCGPLESEFEKRRESLQRTLAKVSVVNHTRYTISQRVHIFRTEAGIEIHVPQTLPPVVLAKRTGALDEALGLADCLCLCKTRAIRLSSDAFTSRAPDSIDEMIGGAEPDICRDFSLTSFNLSLAPDALS